jgi:hypothetical protein
MTDLLKLQDGEATKNSFYRSPKVSPAILHHKEFVEVKTINHSTNIGKLEEVVLYIVADFKFTPLWLIQQWFEDFNRKDSYTTVSTWVSVGLVWIEPTALGIFVRPTKFLLDMMEIKDQEYLSMSSFGLLNHTCGEEQVAFDLMIGNPNSELWQVISAEEDMLSCYHPLKIEPIHSDMGTIVVREAMFKANTFKPAELVRKHEDLRREMKSGKKYTSEFADLSLFPIVYVESDGTVITQTPDVIVPVPRKEGLPQSYSIEIELSAKPPKKYIEIMKHYKDNIMFGKLFYLCGTPAITNLVKTAFREVGGLGTCQLYIMPFVPPAVRLSNYSFEDDEAQAKLIEQERTQDEKN